MSKVYLLPHDPDDEDVDAFVAALSQEKIEKYNPYHDELGRFTDAAHAVKITTWIGPLSQELLFRSHRAGVGAGGFSLWLNQMTNEGEEIFSEDRGNERQMIFTTEPRFKLMPGREDSVASEAASLTSELPWAEQAPSSRGLSWERVASDMLMWNEYGVRMSQDLTGASSDNPEQKNVLYLDPMKVPSALMDPVVQKAILSQTEIGAIVVLDPIDGVKVSVPGDGGVVQVGPLGNGPMAESIGKTFGDFTRSPWMVGQEITGHGTVVNVPAAMTEGFLGEMTLRSRMRASARRHSPEFNNLSWERANLAHQQKLAHRLRVANTTLLGAQDDLATAEARGWQDPEPGLSAAGWSSYLASLPQTVAQLRGRAMDPFAPMRFLTGNPDLMRAGARARAWLATMDSPVDTSVEELREAVFTRRPLAVERPMESQADREAAAAAGRELADRVSIAIDDNVSANLPPGYSVLHKDIHPVSARAREAGNVMVEMNIADESGSQVGHFRFRVDKTQVYLGMAEVDAEHRGKGISTSLYFSMLPMTRDMGVRTMRMNANIHNGAYSWLRMGFLPESDAEWRRFRNRVQNRLNGVYWKDEDPEFRGKVQRVLDRDDRRAAWDLVSIPDRREGARYSKVAELTYDYSFDAEVDFTDVEQAEKLYGYVGLEFITLPDGRVVPVE